MLSAVISRLLQSAVVVFAMSVIVFCGINLIGNPVYLLVPPDASPQDIEAAIRSFGLDQPVWTQYFIFVGNILQGDMGTSFVSGRPALQLIFERFPATLELSVFALAISLGVGVPLGLAVGYWYDRRFARAIMGGSVFGFSMPTFWVGLMFIMIFAVYLGWLPSGGRGETVGIAGFETSLFTASGLRHILLPALTLSLFKVSLVIRLTAAGMREVLDLDYVKFARAKGLREAHIIRVHVLRNVMIPIVTVIGMEFGQLIAFSMVTEAVFSWPGMGKLLIESIGMLDRPVIVSYMIVILLMFILINAVVDALYLVLDPRTRVKAS